VAERERVIPGPYWVYSVPPSSYAEVQDERGALVVSWRNTGFTVMFLEKPFFVRPGWRLIVRKL